jgi:hypothetical protein
LKLAAEEKLSTSIGLVTLRDGQSVFVRSLAFKAIEIEELTDIFFFRPFGWIIARGARALGMTPTHLSIVGTMVGVAGAALLYDDPGIFPFALLILSEIIDSSDGQLARMTGQVTEMGRVLDGVGDYITHGAVNFCLDAAGRDSERDAVANVRPLSDCLCHGGEGRPRARERSGKSPVVDQVALFWIFDHAALAD